MKKNLFFSFDLCTFQMHSVTEGARPFNWLLGWLAGALHLSLISGTRQANGFLFHVNYLQCVQKLTIVSSRLILQLTDHMFTQIHFGTVWQTLWKSTPENEIFFCRSCRNVLYPFRALFLWSILWSFLWTSSFSSFRAWSNKEVIS